MIMKGSGGESKQDAKWRQHMNRAAASFLLLCTLDVFRTIQSDVYKINYLQNTPKSFPVCKNGRIPNIGIFNVMK